MLPSEAVRNSWLRHGLVVEPDGGIEFQTGDNAVQMNSKLRAILPDLFAHLAQKDPWIMQDDEADYRTKRLPYVLMKRNRQRVEDVQLKHAPTGKEYDRNSGKTGRRGWKHREIYIGTLHIIKFTSMAL